MEDDPLLMTSRCKLPPGLPGLLFSCADGRFFFVLVHQIEYSLIKTVSSSEAVGCASDVADDDFNSRGSGAEIDRGLCCELAEDLIVGGALPFGLGLLGIFRCLLLQSFVDSGDDLIGARIGGQGDANLVPKPLARGG